MIFVLAALIGAAAAALFYLDYQRKRPERPTLPAQTPVKKQVTETPQPVAVAEEEPHTPRLGVVEHATDTVDTVELEEVDPGEIATESELNELDETIEAQAIDDSADETVVAESADDFDTLERAHASEEDRSPQEALDALKSGLLPNLPGHARRVRRAWAEYREFSYTKTDAYLADEWSRVAASTGVAAKDVVSGKAAGYEMHLCDLGPATVVAMRRNFSSDIVAEAYRDHPQDTPPAEDLAEVSTVGDFTFYGTDPQAVARMIDSRVHAVTRTLPKDVQAIWVEGEWVLAQLPKTPSYELWEDTLEPLALLADAACTLPPRPHAVLPIDFYDSDPTRPMAHRVAQPPRGEVLDEDEHPPVLPKISPHLVREDDPVILPSRAKAQSRGVVTPHDIGADDVEAIADPNHRAPQHSDFHGTRVLRDTSQGSSIFIDGQAETGAQICGDNTTCTTDSDKEPHNPNAQGETNTTPKGNLGS
ncbi:MAG: hypothetical protein Q4A31_01650 [Corynebacterium sp.]|uniref:hypothetical protein n=1 Tax=Corynebacterium sp. TaxID=1720 RepID=UPI0026DD534A|nr:hypothetical protein [Corynebacterium sp.]MDO4760610.1 hypothetical protein [Corynebacterium sp.]